MGKDAGVTRDRQDGKMVGCCRVEGKKDGEIREKEDGVTQ